MKAKTKKQAAKDRASRSRSEAAAARVSDPAEHGIASALWNNLADGWQIECLCGWISSPDPKMANVGFDFDEHCEE